MPLSISYYSISNHDWEICWNLTIGSCSKGWRGACQGMQGSKYHRDIILWSQWIRSWGKNGSIRDSNLSTWVPTTLADLFPILNKFAFVQHVTVGFWETCQNDSRKPCSIEKSLWQSHFSNNSSPQFLLCTVFSCKFSQNLKLAAQERSQVKMPNL